MFSPPRGVSTVDVQIRAEESTRCSPRRRTDNDHGLHRDSHFVPAVTDGQKRQRPRNNRLRSAPQNDSSSSASRSAVAFKSGRCKSGYSSSSRLKSERLITSIVISVFATTDAFRGRSSNSAVSPKKLPDHADRDDPAVSPNFSLSVEYHHELSARLALTNQLTTC